MNDLSHANADFRDGMPFLGSRLWIDFLNTTPALKTGVVDLLGSPDAVARWAASAGIASVPGSAADRPDALAALRDALRDAFARLADGRPPTAATLALVNGLLAGCKTSAQLVVQGERVVREDRTIVTGPAIAIAVARDFAAFVDAFEAERLRGCASPDCSMLFYDVGRNNRRRWCTMSICGNRDKAAQFRARHTSARPA